MLLWGYCQFRFFFIVCFFLFFCCVVVFCFFFGVLIGVDLCVALAVAPNSCQQSGRVYSGEALAAGGDSKGAGLIEDAGDECGVGVKVVAQVVVVTCSEMLGCGWKWSP